MPEDEKLSRKCDCLSDNTPYIFDTHAHYFHNCFANMPNGMSREELLKTIYESNIKKCIVPAVNYWTNNEMKRLFDKPEYNWIYYAHASHPKYLRKEAREWDEKRWNDYAEMLGSPKCVAVGETGLDYSYSSFCLEHQKLQKKYFNTFIDYANKYRLPVILHIRSGLKDGVTDTDNRKNRCNADADTDAIAILREHPVKFGAVYHCFDGDIAKVKSYYDVGVTCFGIGGKIFYERDLEEAVHFMPEESIVLETDAPYINLPDRTEPNTSISLWSIAERIAIVRKTTTERIIELTTQNAERVFHLTV